MPFRPCDDGAFFVEQLMEPQIIRSRFGSLLLQAGDEEVGYAHDILILPDGTVHRRPKELSKQIYGTSHRISLAEAEQIAQRARDNCAAVLDILEKR